MGNARLRGRRGGVKPWEVDTRAASLTTCVQTPGGQSAVMVDYYRNADHLARARGIWEGQLVPREMAAAIESSLAADVSRSTRR